MLETEDGIVLQCFHLRDVLGRNITCEDGVTRRVEQISHSFRYSDMLLLNEVNEDELQGGAYVHALSLACQMTGTKLPTVDQKKAFSRTMNAFRFQPEEDPSTPGFIRMPSGLLISKR
jgi:hypothetical protein